ncbi:MAG: IclR family transcriptional regulator [Jatrophihabitans sp.]
MSQPKATVREQGEPDASGPLRALQVLETLAGMEQPASLESVAFAMDLPQSKAYRALRSLQAQGYVDHLGRSGYRLGSRAVALASLIGPRPDLLQAARPVISRLSAITSESAALHLRSGAHRVLVLGIESRTRPLGSAVLPGERAPLTTGCSGTAILAYLPAKEATEVINSRPPDQRPTAAALRRIRRDGYALSFSGNHLGLNGIAAPLLDPTDGYPLGSIAIAGDATRLAEPGLRELVQPLSAACAQLAPRLATMLGPNSSQRLVALDVAVQHVVEL